MLSKRGQKQAGQPLRADIELFDRAQENLYAADNPEGAITLCIAENLFQWEAMRDRLQEIARRQEWPEWMASYAPIAGHPAFLQAVAGFVGKHIAGKPLVAEGFCGSAGATSVIEITAMCLADAGQVAVFPAPAYPAYRPDIGSKAGVERYDIQRYAGDFDGEFHPLSVAELDEAYAELGDRFRMLVLTQPDNPTGAVYSATQLEKFADWCCEREIHLVVNEIYALSQFARGAEGIANDSPYSSFLPLLEDRRSPFLHWWYSFSKDFGISGLRIGLLYSRNEEIRSAYTNYNAPHQVSNITQWLLSELLKDHRWVTEYQRENERLLTEAYTTVTATLDKLDVTYAPARGSLFVWADFSSYLEAPTTEAAEKLWESLFENTGVLLTGPGGLGQPNAGWFRIVYSCVRMDALEVACQRLKTYLSTPS